MPWLSSPVSAHKIGDPDNPYSLRQIPLPILYPASRMIPFRSRIVRTGFTFLSEKACQQLDRFRQQPVRIHRETLTESTCFREWNLCNACSQHPRYPAPVQLLKEEVIRCHVVILLFSLCRPIPLPSPYHEFLSQFGSVSQLAALSPPDVLFFHHKWNHSPCTKLASTLLPVCNSGCPTTICKNRCSPSLLCSITSSLNRFVNTFPGSGGIVTRALSRSSISRKYSKSE